MKKILIVAALLAATAAPSYAATMAPPPPPPATPATCFFLPLVPGCLDLWKAKNDEFVSTVAAAPKAPVVAPPAMPMMPSCAKAPAGAGHLFDCKM
jgi:hypothetical protein